MSSDLSNQLIEKLPRSTLPSYLFAHLNQARRNDSLFKTKRDLWKSVTHGQQYPRRTVVDQDTSRNEGMAVAEV
jgi:hypothetical protein